MVALRAPVWIGVNRWITSSLRHLLLIRHGARSSPPTTIRPSELHLIFKTTVEVGDVIYLANWAIEREREKEMTSCTQNLMAVHSS